MDNTYLILGVLVLAIVLMVSYSLGSSDQKINEHMENNRGGLIAFIVIASVAVAIMLSCFISSSVMYWKDK